MKKIKSVGKAWKKFAAVFLSMILTVGLISGALPLEVFAEGDKIIIVERLTLDGYEGGDVLDSLILGGHTVHGSGAAQEERLIPAESMSCFMDENVIVWRVEVEPAADLKQICLNVQNKLENTTITEYCWSRGISDVLTPQTKYYEDTLNRVRLVSVNHVCRELYLGEGEAFNRISQSMNVSATSYEKHTFQNWNTVEGKFSMDTKSTDPITLYAVYSHPEKNTWTENADDVFHWVECTCGEREKVEAHTEGEGKVVKQPTDTDPGEKTYECSKCHHVRSEVIRSTINYSIVMNGYYDGGAMPNTANLMLELWKEGQETAEELVVVPLTNIRIEGNKFVYSCAIQDLDTYKTAYIADGSGFRFPLVDAFLKDGVYEKEFDYYRFRFMDGGEVYNEQYLFSSTWLREPPVPTKENRVFVGWERSDGSRVNLDELKNAAVTEQTTLYAVWEHPADDKWEWKTDGDKHWKECNCGDTESGHTAIWDEGVITKEPTDTETGKKVYKCETCGLMKEVIIRVDGSEIEEGGDETGGNESGDGSGSEGGNESGDGSGETEGGSGTGSGGNGSGDGNGETEGGSGDGTGSGETEGGSGDGTGSGETEGGSGDGTGSGETEGGSGSGDGTGSGETEGGSGDGTGSGETEGGSGSGDGTGSGETEGGSGDGTGSGETEGGSGDGTGSGETESGSGDGTGSGETEGGSGDGTGNGETEGGSGSGDGTGSGETESGSGDGTGNGETEGGSGSGAGSSGSGSVAGNGSGAGSSGNGSGAGSSGNGSGAGSGGNGSGAGSSGSGSGAGSGGNGSGAGSSGNGSGVGSSGTGAEGAGNGSGTGAGGAGGGSGAGSTERDSSGIAHGSNLSTGNGNASYMSQNTGVANDAAVNSGRRTGRDNEPDTGDITHVEVYATIAMIAGLSYLLSYFRDENRGITEEEKNEMVAKLIGWAKKGGCLRRRLALAAIFLLLVYYYSIGKRVSVPCLLAEEEIL